MRTIAAIVLTALALVAASVDGAHAKPSTCAPKRTSEKFNKIDQLAVGKRAAAFTAVLAEAQNVKPNASPADKLACAAVGASAGLALASDLKLPFEQAVKVEAQLQAIAQEGRSLCALLSTGGETADVRRRCFLIDVASATWPAYSAAHRLAAAARDPTFPKDDAAWSELGLPISTAADLARTRWRALSDRAASLPPAEAQPILAFRRNATCAVAWTFVDLMTPARTARARAGADALDDVESAFLADAGEALLTSDPPPAACAAEASSAADCRKARKAAMIGECAAPIGSPR